MVILGVVAMSMAQTNYCNTNYTFEDTIWGYRGSGYNTPGVRDYWSIVRGAWSNLTQDMGDADAMQCINYTDIFFFLLQRYSRMSWYCYSNGGFTGWLGYTINWLIMVRDSLQFIMQELIFCYGHIGEVFTQVANLASYFTNSQAAYDKIFDQNLANNGIMAYYLAGQSHEFIKWGYFYEAGMNIGNALYLIEVQNFPYNR